MPRGASVGAILEAAATARPHAIAAIDEQSSVTNLALRDEARRMHAVLTAVGLEQGDRVLIMLPNSVDYLAVWLGSALGGIVEVPVNTEFQGQMLSYLIEDSDAKAIVTDATSVDRILDAVPERSHLCEVLLTGDANPNVRPSARLRVRHVGAIEPSPDVPMVEVLPRAAIGVMYTSGTTGPAKGTVVSHRHAIEYATACAELLELTSDDVYYAPLPFFHIAGQWALALASLITGATFIIKRRFSVRDFWSDCDRHGVTATFLLGAMAQFLTGQLERADDGEHTLDRVLMVPLVQDLDAFKSRFNVDVTTCYGSTETGVPLVADFEVREATVTGKPRPGYQLRLVDENDEEVPHGEVGELCVRHLDPWVTMIRYHDKDAATVEAFRNQWLHSGDAMRLDSSGTYHFVDRLGDTLRRRGENISSFEVEREVYAHADVQECAALGVPSKLTEEDLVVVVVPKEGRTVDPSELRDFLATRTPRFMVPDRVILRDAMPKTATGKIQKGILKRELVDTDLPDTSGSAR